MILLHNYSSSESGDPEGVVLVPREYEVPVMSPHHETAPNAGSYVASNPLYSPTTSPTRRSEADEGHYEVVT